MAAKMPLLAARGLEAPHFHSTGWHVNQCFTAEDDPDRTRLRWTPPKFVLYKDPALQEVVVEELRLPEGAAMLGYGQSFARVVQNVLDEDHCAELIASVNAKGFTPALLNIGRGNQQLVPGARDGHRVIVDSPELAEWLLGVLLPFLPAELEDGSRLAEMNERLRFLCYTPGQEFPAHRDACFERWDEHPRAGDFSFVTVQLYLHDVPPENGGATTFLMAGRPSHQPRAGSVLLFTQDLLHEGSLVNRGIKYTLRTEVMYSRPGIEVPARRLARAAAVAREAEVVGEMGGGLLGDS